MMAFVFSNTTLPTTLLESATILKGLFVADFLLHYNICLVWLGENECGGSSCWKNCGIHKKYKSSRSSM